MWQWVAVSQSVLCDLRDNQLDELPNSNSLPNSDSLKVNDEVSSNVSYGNNELLQIVKLIIMKVK